MPLRSLTLPKNKGQKEKIAYLSASISTGWRGMRNTLVSITEGAGVTSVTDTCDRGDRTTREDSL